MSQRLLLRDLTVGTNYELQARIKSDGTPSEWSPKFKFTTITDQIAPKPPQNVSFIVDDDSYLANWDTVTENVDNTPAAIFKYEMQLRKGSEVKNFSVAPSDEPVQEYAWTFDRIKQLYGANTTSLDFRVRAKNMARIPSEWSPWNNANVRAPDAPTDAVVEETTDGLKISWTAPVNMNNVAGYRVYIDTVENFTPSTHNRYYEGTATTYTYLTATYGLHYIKIRSYSKFGLESEDLDASGTPKSPFVIDDEAPDVPSGLTATLERTGNTARANLTWSFSDTTENNKDIQGFAVKWYKTGEPTKFYTEFASKEARSLSIDLPQAFGSYTFQIASIDWAANYSAYSAAVAITGSIPGPPPKTEGVTAVAGFDNIGLSWTPSTHDDVVYGGRYEVQLATDAGFTTGVITQEPGGTTIIVSGLNLDTTYYYRVKAIDIDGNSGTYSDTGNITTAGFDVPEVTDGNPPASSPAANVTPGIGALYVTWSPVANADLVTYEVHLSTSSTFTPTLGAGATLVAQTPGTSVSLVKDAAGTALSYTTPYYVRIIAKDGDTTSGNAPAAGTVSTGASPKKAGSGDITTVTADQIGAGSVSAVTITIADTGSMQSLNYSDGAGGTTPRGWRLNSQGFDIRSGTIAAGTLIGGTISSADIRLGVNGTITIDDNSGAIQSSTWNPSAQTGWRLSRNGATFYGLDATISASNIIGDTISGRSLSLNSGGSITGPGFTLSSTGLTISYGTVSASAITTGQLSSSVYVNHGGSSKPMWLINMTGGAEFNDVSVRGRLVVGPLNGTDSSYMQSGNYSASAGWKVSASGDAEFNQAKVRGGVEATGSSGQYVRLEAPGNPLFNSSNPQVSLKSSSYTYPGQLFLNANKISLYPPSNSSARGTFLGLQEGVGVEIAGGLTVSGGVTLLGGVDSFYMNAAINMNGFPLNECSAVNGGPTINGNPTWTASGSGGSANVNWNGGKMQPVTSSRRYKTNIRDLIVDLNCVYALVPRKYERIGEEETTEIGFIAEEALEAGLDDWVMYNEAGEVESFDYFKYVVALQASAVDLNERVTLLEDENQALKTKVSQLESLEQRLATLEARLDN